MGGGAQTCFARPGGRIMIAAVSSSAIAERRAGLDWQRIEADLDAHGCAIASAILSREHCESVAQSYSNDDLFRSRVVMARHGFGRGEYKYFQYPLPDTIAGLRTAVYPRLAPIANRWNEAMGMDVRYSEEHADFIARCHEAGQRKPTPLLLRYEAGDYNCLH